MKDLLSLTVLSFSLALCYGFCFRDLHKVKVKNGELLRPNGCTDIYDGSEHPFGSAWNTAECMRCKCKKKGMECCARYGGLVEAEGCKAVIDPETCSYKFYKLDDPSTLCAY
ncbi:small serum protein 5-like isoform X1 [Rhineura floridana]|uniref:small serum protein 5-like isoform X1 n=1 Tax=Rhineura floridana TaxID=261503 RepID=UPI002AC87197|nr:small serum protein 5-like isoform X1 [Rhineura floridana]